MTLDWTLETAPKPSDAPSTLPNEKHMVEDFAVPSLGNKLLLNVHKRPQGLVVDDLHLKTAGVGDVAESSTERIVVFTPLVFSTTNHSMSGSQYTAFSIAQELPVVEMSDCGEGDTILASIGLEMVRVALDLDRRALHYIRSNGPGNDSNLLPVTSG